METSKADLLSSVNKFIEEYLSILSSNQKTILELTNTNSELINQQNSQVNELKEIRKTCCDYEKIINEYQDKLNTESKFSNPSLIKTQADQLEQKDRYIEQLEKKVDFLQKKINEKPSMRCIFKEKTDMFSNNST